MIFRKKIWTRILLITVLLILMVMGVGTYLCSRWKGIIQARLEEKVNHLSNGFYKVKVGEMRIEILKGRLMVGDISLYPDSAVFARLQVTDSLPPLFLNVALGAVEVHGINIANTGDERTLNLKKIWVREPRIQLVRSGREKEKTGTDTIPKSLYEQISPFLNSINIGDIDISNGSFHYTTWMAGDTTHYQVDYFDLVARNFQIDSTTHIRQHFFYCDDIHLKINKYTQILPNGMFALSFDQMEVALADSTLTFNGLKLVPQYDRQHFAAKNPGHTNWMKLDIGNIQCFRLDYHKLLFEKSVNIDSISVEGLRYVNMKNREVEQAAILKPMLYEYIQKAPLPLDIRTIHVAKAVVVYEDQPKGKTKPGMLTLNKMEGDLHGITNIVSQKDQYMTLSAKTYVQGEGVLHTTFRLPVDPHNNHFEISGKMGKMHLRRLNAMLEPFLVRIKDGMTEHIDFTIKGNNRQAHLDMAFLYKDLRIALLKESNNHLVRRALLSDIANGMVLFNNNPEADGNHRHAQTVTKRDIYRASFHYFCHTLIDGMKETIGITKKKQEQLIWLKDEAKKLHILKKE